MNSMDIGFIKNARDSKYYTYEIKVLNETYLDEVVDFHLKIIEQLNNPELCVTITPEEFIRMMGRQGRMFGAFVENKLIAFRGILFPEDSEENLGAIIGLQKQELNLVAHLEVTNVHPDFRGNGLQKRMLTIAFEMLRHLKRHRHIFTIASPLNYPSVKNVFSENMLLIDIQRMYGGRLRCIFYKDLSNSLPLDLNNLQRIAMKDIEGQKKLIDEGYAGFRFSQGSTVDTVVFAKRVDRSNKLQKPISYHRTDMEASERKNV
ncbi:MAG: hypothetical protein AB2421_10500 [Thermotaleaceae bacterium]